MDQRRRRTLKALGVGLGAFVVFGLVTDLIPNERYLRMVPRTPLDYLFLTLTAGFLGLYVYQQPAESTTGEEGVATTGAIAGFLAFGCPVCNVLLLSLFGSSALLTVFDPLRPLLGVLSVGLFGGLLYVRSQRTCESCEEPPAQPSVDQSQ